MNEQAMPQMQLLLRDKQVRDEIMLLTPTHYQEAIEDVSLLKNNFVITLWHIELAEEGDNE